MVFFLLVCFKISYRKAQRLLALRSKCPCSVLKSSVTRFDSWGLCAQVLGVSQSGTIHIAYETTSEQ